MIVHTSVPLHEWPVVQNELLASVFTGVVKAHIQTHTTGHVCIETRTQDDLNIVTEAVHNAVARHRKALKKQLMSRRTTQCKTKHS